MRLSRCSQFEWLQIAYTALQLFTRNGLQNHAAATAFYFLLSATPLLLLLSYALQVLGRVAEQSVPASILMAALYTQLHLDSLTDYGFIPRHAQLTAGGIGLLTLILSSRGLVNAVQGAFNIVFPDRNKRNMVVSWILPLLILPLLLLLMGLGALAQLTLAFLAQNDFIGTGNATLLQVLNSLFAFFILWAVLFAAYWQLPRHHPPARHAAWFALFAAVSLVLLFSLFGAFFKLENYHNLYGALGGVVFVLIGAYFAFLLLYLWAQALYAYGKADLTALEKLFLAGSGEGASKLERFVFSDTGRLLDKYGRVYPPGHVLIQEGDNSQTAYFLYAGRAMATKRTDAGPSRLGELAEGQLFGEMAYLLKEKRTASVVAESEITVLELPPRILEALMQQSAPLSRQIIGTLCQRLERMNMARQAQP
ncbi:MAG: cyclic nucleotide-binding protein [Hydrogenophilales bacterium 16-64-46]|nr:MAG: cyclic nucleotide-binding protein [Hydrogenophilales bacterium 12-64-13]OYZ05471.1 MAG: cyclic nucleotide-binding protein [Hydrogenophilales bacterium 16-64-46]OZA40051.1 MAG: cyclic nucleotide-binding protein [Hydrogenophilales bacterium 17-64-34]HQT00917.1 YhjD/YihY/BrkB family envelope integrity protein [Thiobacillus sp.]